MENNMRRLAKERLEKAVIDSSIADTYVGQSIVGDAANAMRTLVLKLKTDDGRLQDEIEFMTTEDSLLGACYSVVELILSAIVLTKENIEDLTKPKVINVRMSSMNRIRKGIFSHIEEDDQEFAIKCSLTLFECALTALEPWVESKKVNESGTKTIIQYSMRSDIHNGIVADFKERVENEFYALPMSEPPADWRITKNQRGKYSAIGGYPSHQYPLIRSGKEDMKAVTKVENFLDDSRSLQSLNEIQSVAFRVNKEVLQKVKDTIESPPIKPEMSEEVKLNKRSVYQFYQDYPTKEDREGLSAPEISEESRIYDSALTKYKTLVGKLVGKRLCIKIADLAAEHEKIYFPNNFDYRGRMYPIASSLSPQGDDISKGILEFAEPTHLTKDGFRALIAYLASVWGHDKEPFETRHKLGKEMMWDWDSYDYTKAEEPFVFYQIKLTIQAILETGDMISHCSLAIDGSCNGLQHMAAITMDKKGGAYVNVGGDEERQDIYMEVAECATQVLADKITNFNTQDWIAEASEKAEKYAKKDGVDPVYPTEADAAVYFENLNASHRMIGGEKARKIAKRPVMINPYGGTYMGYKNYVMQTLMEYYPELAIPANSNIITASIVNAMTIKLLGGKLYQGWVRKTFSDIAKEGIEPHYKTPDGFVVINSSYEMDVEKIFVQNLRGIKNRYVQIKKIKNELNPRKIGTRAQPNIIHSLDATHLRMTASECVSKGIKQLWFIHDSFGTNPNDYAQLNKITREQFIKLYDPESETHPIKVIIEALQAQLNEAGSFYQIEDFPTFEGSERLELDKLGENQYFFA